MWKIQRKSFCNRGIWRCLNQLMKDFEEMNKTLNGK